MKSIIEKLIPYQKLLNFQWLLLRNKINEDFISSLDLKKGKELLEKYKNAQTEQDYNELFELIKQTLNEN